MAYLKHLSVFNGSAQEALLLLQVQQAQDTLKIGKMILLIIGGRMPKGTPLRLLTYIGREALEKNGGADWGYVTDIEKAIRF